MGGWRGAGGFVGLELLRVFAEFLGAFAELLRVVHDLLLFRGEEWADLLLRIFHDGLDLGLLFLADRFDLRLVRFHDGFHLGLLVIREVQHAAHHLAVAHFAAGSATTESFATAAAMAPATSAFRSALAAAEVATRTFVPMFMMPRRGG